ncbi:hypothetical protein D3C78_1775400 [compost metagenome]
MEFVLDCLGSAKRYRCRLIFHGIVQIIFRREQRTIRTLPHFHFRAGYQGVHEVGL